MIFKVIGIVVFLAWIVSGTVALAHIVSDPRRLRDFKRWLGIDQ